MSCTGLTDEWDQLLCLSVGPKNVTDCHRKNDLRCCWIGNGTHEIEINEAITAEMSIQGIWTVVDMYLQFVNYSFLGTAI